MRRYPIKENQIGSAVSKIQGCLFDNLTFYLSIFCIDVCLYFYLSIYLVSIYVCVSVYLSIFVCMSICLSIFHKLGWGLSVIVCHILVVKIFHGVPQIFYNKIFLLKLQKIRRTYKICNNKLLGGKCLITVITLLCQN